jgi:tripartite-type tricarboxylate transporter receptor subunit TctC
MLVNPAVPAKTLPEFIAYAKANPGKINMASGGIGAASHIAGELFKMMAGVDMVHVPYRGSPPALTDLLGGQVQAYFSLLPPALEHVRAGKLRALALTSATRSQMLADLPAIAEFVPGYEASSVWGLGAPKDTPAAVIEKLNREVNAVLAEPKINETLLSLGGTVLAGSPAEFGKLMADETQKWSKVIRAAGIKAE